MGQHPKQVLAMIELWESIEAGREQGFRFLYESGRKGGPGVTVMFDFGVGVPPAIIYGEGIPPIGSIVHIVNELKEWHRVTDVYVDYPKRLAVVAVEKVEDFKV